MVPCCICDNSFSLTYKEMRQAPANTWQFCGAVCLLKYLIDEDHSGRVANTYDAPVVDDYGYSLWDSRLKMWFRSSYEMVVARLLSLYSINFKYECYGLKLKGGRMYTPDFFLPDKKIFLEVKGRWLGSGKKKFIEARKNNVILLIPEYLVKNIKEFLKEYHAEWKI